MSDQTTIAMKSPQGDRWIIQIYAWANKCPGTGRWHKNCIEHFHSCKGTRRKRKLTQQEAKTVIEALGYEITT